MTERIFRKCKGNFKCKLCGERVDYNGRHDHLITKYPELVKDTFEL